MMMKYTFIILNYETYWETKACVESIFHSIGILKLGEEYAIVIVDNGSSNDSYVQLQKLYSCYNDIYVIRSKKNVGFAQGNNIGFRFAVENLKASFIFMINSDILITDNHMLEKVSDDYLDKQFAVAGPNVKGPDGTSLNPMKSELVSIEDIRNKKKRIHKQIIECNLLVDPFITGFKRITAKKKSDSKINDTSIELNLRDGFQLHGCFLIFSPIYLKKYNGIYSKTFLYYEEDFLRLRCINNNFKMFFLNDIQAIHNESRTENYIGGKALQRHKRRYINMLNSLNLLERYLIVGTED
jgi:GT2 family glycosyltransferase